jgi:transcriptional regulator with XRE-family HTH domain
VLPEPQTLGEKLQRRRLELGLTQKEVARELGISESTVVHWEKDQTEPLVRLMPNIIHFLGYDPVGVPRTLGERMRALRKGKGWTIDEAAASLGVDPTAWGSWERSGVIPWARYREKIDRFIDANQTHPT